MTRALIYHDVVPAAARETVGFPGPLAARYKLEPTAFAAHLDRIAAAGVAIGTVPGDGRAAGAALTFDDGGASALATAAALERRGWRGHFFVTTGRLGSPGFLDADGVRELARRGHVVGSHSHRHPTYMGKLSAPQILDEWERSRDELGAILGQAPFSASVPGGLLSPAVVRMAARSGYRLLMTSQPTGRVRRHDELAVVGRYTVWSTTTPARAAGYATGSAAACGRLWLEWQAKAVPKHLSPRLYQALRRWRAGRG